MLSYIIATIRDTQEILGYRVFTIQNGKGSLADVSLTRMQEICNKGFNSFQNAEYDMSKQELVGTAMKINSLPIINSKGCLRTTAGLTVTYRVVDDNNITQGFGVVDSSGLNVPITTKKLIQLSSQYKNTNFDIVSNANGDLVVKPKGKCKFPKVTMQAIKNVKSYNSKTDSKADIEKAKAEASERAKDLQIEQLEEIILREKHLNNISSKLASSGSDNKLPGLHVYNMLDISESEFNIPCQDKFLLAARNLDLVSPYYSLMYQSIPHIACTAIPTMAVTEDKLFYNQAFVSSLTISELTFVMIHEMLHIAMKHSVRHGKKDNELWNIATDLFINEIIQRDFGCRFGGDEVEVDKVKQGKIKCPNFGVFLYTIGESLDFGTDTPESIYMRLVEENKNNSNQGSQSGNQSGQGSQGSQNGQSGQNSQDSQSGQGQQGSQGNNSGNSKGNSSGDNQGSDGQNGNQSGDNQSGQGSQNEQNKDNSDGNMNGNQGNNSGSNQNSNTNNNGVDDENPFEGSTSNGNTQSTLEVEIVDSDNKEYNQIMKPVDVIYKGKRLQGNIPMDVVSNNENQLTGEDIKKAKDESDLAIKRIVTKRQMEEAQTQKTIGLTSGAEVVERYIKFGMSLSYNWERILMNIATVDAKKMYTLARPNKNYMQRGITLASRQKIGRPTKIGGIKFCVDTSGSVSEKELSEIYTKIAEILLRFDLDAELIFWDTSVNSVGKFSDLKELVRIKPLGGGGTELSCVFDYLMGKTRVNGRREETHVKDISVVMIFTDGAFNLRNRDEYAKYFGRNTVFVVNDGCIPFEPPFGKLAKRD